MISIYFVMIRANYDNVNNVLICIFSYAKTLRRIASCTLQKRTFTLVADLVSRYGTHRFEYIMQYSLCLVTVFVFVYDVSVSVAYSHYTTDVLIHRYTNEMVVEYNTRCQYTIPIHRRFYIFDSQNIEREQGKKKNHSNCIMSNRVFLFTKCIPTEFQRLF